MPQIILGVPQHYVRYIPDQAILGFLGGSRPRPCSKYINLHTCSWPKLGEHGGYQQLGATFGRPYNKDRQPPVYGSCSI